MREFDRLRARILALFPDLISYAKETKANETERRLRSALAELELGRLVVVVCGEFKRGKSSLLNALLEEPGLFPVDDYYATSLVSTISHAETEKITVLLAGTDGTSEARQISRSEMAGYVTESGNRDNRKGVERVEIVTPNPHLASGLTFVDTPGVGGIYVRHTLATRGYLPFAHAVLFVVDATQVLTDSELHFLGSAAETAKITGEEDALICVLTKVDLISDGDRLIANTRAKLADVMSRPPDQVTVVPVSSKAKLRYLARGDERYLRLSNFAELDRVIWAALARRQAKVVLGTAVTELERGAQALLQPIESELSALRADTEEKAERLRSAQRKRRQRLAELAEKGPQWRRELKDRLADMAGAVESAAGAELDDVWHKFRHDYLDRQDFLREPSRLVSRLDDDAIAVVGTASKLLSKRAAKLQREFADKAGFDLGDARVRDLPDPPVSRLRVSGRLEDAAGETTPSPGRSGAAAAAAGAVAGAALGTAILPGFGTVVGAVLGGLAGRLFGRRRSYQAPADTYQAPRQDVAALRRSIRDQIAPLEKEQRHYVKDAIRDAAGPFTEAVLAELDSCVIQERESLEDAVRRAETASQHSAETAKAREAQLARERVPLDDAREAVRSLAVEVGRLSAGEAAEAGEAGEENDGG